MTLQVLLRLAPPILLKLRRRIKLYDVNIHCESILMQCVQKPVNNILRPTLLPEQFHKCVNNSLKLK